MAGDPKSGSLRSMRPLLPQPPARPATAGAVSVAPGVESVPETLKMARERRGLTATALAANLGRSTSYVSRAESSLDTFVVTGQGLLDYAQALDVPVSLLTKKVHREPPEGTHFRSNKVPLRVRNRVEAEANFAAHIINALLRSGLVDPTFAWALPTFDIDEHGSPETVAQVLRNHWRLGTGPIQNIAAVLESAGVFILPLPADITGVDAITIRCDGPATAITLLAMDRPHDRLRQTLAHELGHLVISSLTPVGLKEVEDRVDRFAAEFLIPYNEIRDDLKGVTPSQLPVVFDLHRTWGAHPAALIRRAYMHGGITQQQYHYWFRALNAKGLARGPLPSSFPVEPRSAKDLIATIKDEGLPSVRLQDYTDHTERDVAPLFGTDWPYGSRLSLVSTP